MGMLPQSLALKVLPDVAGKVKPGTSRTDPPSADQVGFRHGLREYLLENWGHQCAYCELRNVTEDHAMTSTVNPPGASK
jgi:hypothetical protein